MPVARQRLPSMVKVSRPTECYRVEQALINRKIYPLDTSTLQYLTDLVNVPSLYLTLIPKEKQLPPAKPRFGFNGLKKSKEKSLPSDFPANGVYINAILYFDSPNPMFFTGFDLESGLTVYHINVWDDREVPKWKRLAQQLAEDLVVVKRGKLIPKVVFTITSSCLPADPKSSRTKLVFPVIECSNHAVSNIGLLPGEDDCLDEKIRIRRPPI